MTVTSAHRMELVTHERFLPKLPAWLFGSAAAASVLIRGPIVISRVPLGRTVPGHAIGLLIVLALTLAIIARTYRSSRSRRLSLDGQGMRLRQAGRDLQCPWSDVSALRLTYHQTRDGLRPVIEISRESGEPVILHDCFRKDHDEILSAIERCCRARRESLQIVCETAPAPLARRSDLHIIVAVAFPFAVMIVAGVGYAVFEHVTNAMR